VAALAFGAEERREVKRRVKTDPSLLSSFGKL
jgi:hypothetical protein